MKVNLINSDILKQYYKVKHYHEDHGLEIIPKYYKAPVLLKYSKLRHSVVHCQRIEIHTDKYNNEIFVKLDAGRGNFESFHFTNIEVTLTTEYSNPAQTGINITIEIKNKTGKVESEIEIEER